MSKSLGNFVTASEALERFSSDALRLFFLGSHYRSSPSYADEGVAAQERAAERLRNALSAGAVAAQADPLSADPYRERFVAAMDDDLNTPQALAVLFDLAHEINRARAERNVKGAQAALKELAGVLGLTLEPPEDSSTGDLASMIELLIETRAELRAAKRFDLADRIRDSLAALGFALEDTARGTEWKRSVD